MPEQREFAEVGAIGIDDDRLPAAGERLAGHGVEVGRAGRFGHQGAEEAVAGQRTCRAVAVEVIRAFAARVVGRRHGDAIGARAAVGCGEGVRVIADHAAGVVDGVGQALHVERGRPVELVGEVDRHALAQVGADNQRLDQVAAQAGRHLARSLLGAQRGDVLRQHVHGRAGIVVAKAVERHAHKDGRNVVAALRGARVGAGIADGLGGGRGQDAVLHLVGQQAEHHARQQRQRHRPAACVE